MISKILRDDKYSSNLISLSHILRGDSVLLIDNERKVLDDFHNLSMNIKLSLGDPLDFRSITKYPEEFMNNADTVVCPSAMYDINCSDYQDVLKCLVWAMKEKSKLVFSYPNYKLFEENKVFSLKRDKFIIEYKKRYLRIRKKAFFKYKDDEYWYKTTVMNWIQIFQTWNSQNNLCFWNTEDIIEFKSGYYNFVRIELNKKI